MGAEERYPWQEACAQAIRESHPVEVTGKQRYRAGVRVGQTEEEGRAFFCYSWHWCQELEGTDIDLGWLSHSTLTPTLIFYLSIIVPWWGLISKFHFPNCLWRIFWSSREKKGLLINGVQFWSEVSAAIGSRTAFVFGGKRVKSRQVGGCHSNTVLVCLLSLCLNLHGDDGGESRRGSMSTFPGC